MKRATFLLSVRDYAESLIESQRRKMRRALLQA
jgi:hypothetical protein